MKILIKPLDEDWAVRERYVLTRCGEALPACTQALIDTILAHQGAAGSRAARKPKARAGG